MAVDYQRFFETFPGVCALLSPDFRILAVNEAFERASMRAAHTLIGRALFDAFPDNRADESADGVHNLRASLEQVRRHKHTHVMRVQRYDFENPATPGAFLERHWQPTTTPVLDAAGELQFIIHVAVDVTKISHLENKVRAAEAVLRDEHQRLIEANVALEAANEELEDHSGSLDAKKYLQRVSAAALRRSQLIDDCCHLRDCGGSLL